MGNAPPKITMRAGGHLVSGWTRAEIDRSIEGICNGFTVELTDYDPSLGIRRLIHPGDACDLMVDGETVISGWVDKNNVEYDPTTHKISFTGRDATGDLVDCAAFHDTDWGGWAGSVDTIQIVGDLVKPFGIRVSADVDAGKAFDFQIQAGESVFETIERLTRSVGVLPVSDSKGGLLLTQGGTGPRFQGIKRGRDIVKMSGGVDHSNRFQKYIVHGQDGEGYIDPGNSAVPQGLATDSGITRYRPLVIIAEYPGDAGTDTFNRRALWEATVRAGRATRFTATLQGWRDSAGLLWAPNGLVPVTDSFIEVDDTLLLARVKLVLDEGGSRAELTVTRPDAFKLTPLGPTFDFELPVYRKGEPLLLPNPAAGGFAP
jgi:prophage tail gpP-like protein